MIKKHFKAIKFENFIISTSETSKDEIESLIKSDYTLQYIISEENSFLGFDELSENYFIYEWVEYEIYGTNDYPLKPEFFYLHGTLDKFLKTGKIFLKNFVGLTKFMGIFFEVHSIKLDYKKVNDLTDYIDKKILNLSLAFNKLGVTNKRFLNKDKSDYEFTQFIFVYNLFKSQKIQESFNLVIEKPYSKFEKSSNVVDISLLQDFSNDTLVDIFSSSEFRESDTNLLLTNRLNGHVPTKIIEHRTQFSNNNNENQFVLFFLNLCLKILNKHIIVLQTDLASQKNTKQPIDELFLEELYQYRSTIYRYIRSRFFQGIGKLNTVNRSSTVLTKRQGYKQLYSYYLGLKASPGELVNKKDFISLFQNKSIDKLYEYAALFFLDDCLRDIYSSSPLVSSLNIVNPQKNYSINLDESNNKIYFCYEKEKYPKVTLYFQKIYSFVNLGSYSVSLKPDFSLKIESESKVDFYHFDTKFKLKVFDNQNKNLSHSQIYAKENDLKSMHAYKDGIFNTIGAFVLFPANDHSSKKIYTDTSHRNENGYRYNGIGAVPFNLSGENIELTTFIREIITHYIL